MAKLLKLRRGTTTQHGSFTGAEGEVTIDTTKDTAVVHDGSTQGGTPLAKENMSNVTSTNIVSRIDNSALAGVKVQPNFGSQQVETSGAIVARNGLTALAATEPQIVIQDSDTGNTGNAAETSIQFRDGGSTTQGQIGFHDVNSSNLFIDTAGTGQPINCRVGGSATQLLIDSAGIDVVGNITATGDAVINGGDVTISGAGQPSLHLTDTSDNPDWSVQNNDGQFRVLDATNGTARFVISTGGNATFYGDVSTTGNITVTGTVDGRDVAQDGGKLDELYGSSNTLKNTVNLADGVTATTQAQSDNSTKVSTTAYVRTAITNASPFPSGTKMLFQQTSAPTGWTKVTSGVDNKALRVVSGTAGSGGSNAFSNTLASRSITANADNTTITGNVSVANQTQTGNVSVSIANASTGGTVNSHTLSINEIPSHTHGMVSGNYYSSSPRRAAVNNYRNQGYNAQTEAAGGGGGHSHGFTGGSHSHNANASFSGDTHNHNATFTAAAHNHSINVTNLDLAVAYLDVIIASKD